MKAVRWAGNSKDDLRAFPTAVQDEAGYQLFKLQCGLEPNDWKPMPSVGAGVREIRIHDRAGAFRVIYLAVRHDGIHVLHCFQKKMQKTSLHDLRLAQQRLNNLPR